MRVLAEAELEPGDVLLSGGLTSTSLLISYLDHSPYAHAMLWTGESVLESTPERVVERSLAESIAAGSRRYVVAYRRLDAPPSALASIVRVARERPREPYPLSDVLLMAYLIAVKGKVRPWDAEGRTRFRAALPELLARARKLEGLGAQAGLTCSELVATAYAEGDHGRYALQLAPLEGELLRGAPEEDGCDDSLDAEWSALVASCQQVVALQREARARAKADPFRAAIAAGVSPMRMVTPKDLANSDSLKCLGIVRARRGTQQRVAVAESVPTTPSEQPLPPRVEPALVAVAPRASGGRILFVTSTPSGRDAVGTDKEWAAIAASLERSTHREQLDLLRPTLHASLSELAAALVQQCPDVIHFAGHGDASGVLLVGRDDAASVVDAQALTEVVFACAPHANLIVLNACDTSELARRLATRVPCVVGISGRIRASEAQRFAQELYLVLGKGVALSAAFVAARSVLQGCAAEPVLALKEPSAGELRLVARDGDASAREALRTKRGTARRARAVQLALGASGVAVICLWALSDASGAAPRASPLASLTGGVLRPGSSRDEARAAYDACLAQRTDDALSTCGDSFERSLFARELASGAAVVLAPFRMERHEVSNAQFTAFLNAQRASLRVERDPAVLRGLDLPAPAVMQGDDWLVLVGVAGESTELPDTALAIVHEAGGFTAAHEQAQHPVRMVSLRGAQRYCAAHGRRLPSAEEWEWAARGPAQRPYPWGTQPRPCSRAVYDRGMFHACASLGDAPQAVAKSEDVTPEGIYDLGGNVSEWTSSTYGAPDVMMVRGGHFRDPLAMLQGTRIFRAHRAELYRELGFRCATSD